MAKVIMLQGTMSNVGKSFLTAGLCRVFVQDGYKTAPFKSQNMALNSYITEEGLEIGRAQAMQAEACRIKPRAAMNPVLLKPTTDVGSQVIVNGVSRGNMPAREYFKYKKSLVPEILKAYESLAAEYDVIVVEGAGSPAEINLKQEDIVNMGLAKLLDAPVLLIGDIDRGGVFAQLAGTLLLLEEEERERVKGLILNKFRGDKSILAPGLAMLTELTGKPVLGVIPYGKADVEEEDSLSERLYKKADPGRIKIKVVRLPRISNFTDFHPLEIAEGISLEYVSAPEQLTDGDMVIIPGSKSTIDDLLWMRESGLEASILKLESQGVLILGICGGYQMLGEEIHDPGGLEGRPFVRGMGLLPVKTWFLPEKTTKQVRGRVGELTGCLKTLSGCCLEGYEIHMGNTVLTGEGKAFSVLFKEQAAPKEDGCVGDNVMGTYLHGIFDSQEFTEAVFHILLEKKGYERDSLRPVDLGAYKEEQFDLLADLVRENLDMKAVYNILGLPGTGE